jgi:hypothetical protein
MRSIPFQQCRRVGHGTATREASKPDVSVEDLCKLDDAVYNAVDGAGRAIEDQQTALNEKLDRVRQRRTIR